MQVAYIVPSLLCGPSLSRCLDSILNQSVPPSEILVIANGRPWFSESDRVRVITLPCNAGYDRACNLGITQSESPFLALVNDDVTLPENWAERLLPSLNGQTRAAVTGVQVDDRGEPSCAGSRWNRRYQAVETSRPDEVEFLNFSAVMMKRGPILDLGLLPSSYFAYYEDVDLSLSMKKARYEWYVDPEVSVSHQVSRTAPALGYRRWYLLLRNRYWTLCRHYGPGFVLKKFPLLLRADLFLWKKLAGRFDLVLRAYGELPFYPRLSHG